jgi:ectoine hydroxylase-related dioxygenase (phytanoyl-CoA dioxygenase family)
MLVKLDCRRDPDWLPIAVTSLRLAGCCVVESVLAPSLLQQLRSAMYEVREKIRTEVGAERLARAGELGVLRLMTRYDPVFFRLLEFPEVLRVVDATVSPTAILHLQNGFILPPSGRAGTPKVFQNSFHQDFPRYLEGYLASVNVFFTLDIFERENGATLLVPGSHQRAERPPLEYLERACEPVECGAGAMILFDSTLWHAAGVNASASDRLAINHQFTRSWIKQQLDYTRALGPDVVTAQRPRTQQLLGYYTRVASNLDEYYRPEEERVYRAGQG